MYWAYGGWGGQRLPLPCLAKALPTSLLDWVGLHSTVIDPFSGCGCGFDYGFCYGCDSDCGCGCHGWVICSFRGHGLDTALFLLLAMETRLAGNLRILCAPVVGRLRPSLDGWRHP